MFIFRTRSDLEPYSEAGPSLPLPSSSSESTNEIVVNDDNTRDAENSGSSFSELSHLNNFNGSRFSKSPKEREKMLFKRKEELLKHAKKSYLTKQRRPALNSQPSTSSEN